MRPLPVVLSFLAVTLSAVLAASRLVGSTAQDATPAADDRKAVVGSWRIVVNDASGMTHPALMTLGADGTMAVSEPPLLPAPPGAPFTLLHIGGGNWVWESTSERTAAITFDFLAADENAHPVGTFTVRGTLDLSGDGQRFEGPYDVMLTDPAGNVGPAGAGTFSGTRMPVVPVGSPSPGTPPATGTPAS